ncbi:beta-2-microglobulin-like [Aquarana catesbeiana]|uniref:beta-2-microglobulin-like n=1 Tax=Aquarana catesbeiana TaxID=8400 RepID=UPI003CCA3723
MKTVVFLSVLIVVIGVVLGDSNVKPPQVYVYTREPVEYGKKNQLMCHCTDFHPPRIELQLKQGDMEIPNCNQTDMTFKEDWAYYLTKHVEFVPEKGVDYSCNVRHNGGSIKTYRLDPLM